MTKWLKYLSVFHKWRLFQVIFFLIIMTLLTLGQGLQITGIFLKFRLWACEIVKLRIFIRNIVSFSFYDWNFWFSLFFISGSFVHFGNFSYYYFKKRLEQDKWLFFMYVIRGHLILGILTLPFWVFLFQKELDLIPQTFNKNTSAGFSFAKNDVFLNLFLLFYINIRLLELFRSRKLKWFLMIWIKWKTRTFKEKPKVYRRKHQKKVKTWRN